MTFHLAPSLLAADFWRLGDMVEETTKAGATVLHIDVMDGHFVPNLTMGPDVVKALKKNSDAILDVHLMVTDPGSCLDAFMDAGADWISFHVEAAPHAHRLVQKIQNAGLKAGLVLNPGTPISHLEGMIDHIDYVLLMSVNPGFGGQKFIESTYKRLGQLRELIANSENSPFIQVDGGIGAQNIEALVKAGMSVAVAGSSVFRAPSIGDATRQLIQLAEAVHEA